MREFLGIFCMFIGMVLQGALPHPAECVEVEGTLTFTPK